MGLPPSPAGADQSTSTDVLPALTPALGAGAVVGTEAVALGALVVIAAPPQPKSLTANTRISWVTPLARFGSDTDRTSHATFCHDASRPPAKATTT
jgi:hypothetical protein